MEDQELIEAYFSNELTANEQNTFQARLKTDEEFAKEVELYQHIIVGIRQQGDEAQMMEKMKGWDQEVVEERPVRTKPFFSAQTWKMAAVLTPLLALAGIAYYYFQHTLTSTSTPQELYASYFTPYEDVLSSRSAEEGALGRAMSFYNMEDYHQAAPSFEKVITGEEKEFIEVASLYGGISYLMLDSMQQATRLLKEVTYSENPLFREVSEWYLLLAYLKEDQEEAFNKQMGLILIDEDHLYHEQIKRLHTAWRRFREK